MIAILLSTFFAASGLLALAAMADTWHRHGAAVFGLRAELLAFEPSRDVRIRISELRVRRTATVLRPSFTAAAQRPSRPVDLPAAA